MPAFVPIPNTALVEMIYREDNQIMEQTYHVVKDGAWGVLEFPALGQAFKGWWQTNLLAGCSNTVQLISIKMTDLGSQNGPLYEYLTGLPLGGGNGSSPLPNNVTVAIKFTTALRGRSFRGRTFHVGLCQNQVNQNLITGGQLSYMHDGYFALLGAVNVAGYQLVVASRRHLGAPRVTGVATVIVDVQVNPTVDSQRRRLPERGR